MMLKKKSPRMAAAKSFYAIPVIVCAMALFASPALAKYRSALTEVKVTNNFLNDQIEEDISSAETIEIQTLFYVDGVATEDISKISEKDIASINIIKANDTPEWNNHSAWEDHNKNDYRGIIEMELKKDEPAKQTTYILNGNIGSKEELKAIVDVVNGSSSYDDYQNGDRSQTLVIAKTTEEEQPQAPTEDKPYLRTEKMPVFQEDGDLVAFRNWVNANLKYPKEAAMNNIQGTVTTKFVIDTDGSIVDAEILRSPNDLLSEEAVRVIKSSSGMWQPGEQSGKKVKVVYTLPIIFRLTSDEEPAKKTTEEPTEKAELIISKLDKAPKFQEDGGVVAFRNWVYTQLRYPKEAAMNNIQGVVVASFKIDTDGSIIDIEVQRSPNDLLSEETRRVIESSSGMWTAGELDGEKFAVKYSIPVEFRLSNGDEETTSNNS